jgi:hypothetical protein
MLASVVCSRTARSSWSDHLLMPTARCWQATRFPQSPSGRPSRVGSDYASCSCGYRENRIAHTATHLGLYVGDPGRQSQSQHPQHHGIASRDLVKRFLRGTFWHYLATFTKVPSANSELHVTANSERKYSGGRRLCRRISTTCIRLRARNRSEYAHPVAMVHFCQRGDARSYFNCLAPGSESDRKKCDCRIDVAIQGMIQL